MKKFDIITEADARVLETGETVMLARRGHITPLAQDTLRERRVTVADGRRSLGRRRDARAAGRDPRRGDRQRSHRRRAAACRWCRFCAAAACRLTIWARDGTEPVDYPDIAASVARPVARGEADAGIVIDGAGIGSAIAANKIRGVRAVMATTETIARYSREHNGANVLTLGATLVTDDEARAIVATWIGTPMREPRYIRRLAKIRDLER